MERARVPSSALPPRPQQRRVRVLGRLAPADAWISQNPQTGQISLRGVEKPQLKGAFDALFAPEVNQEEVSSTVLPDLLHSLFNGIDSSLVSFGGFSKGKADCLYDPAGLYRSAIYWAFQLLDEYRLKRPDCRFSLRLSALYYQQRDGLLDDLFGQFNSDRRRQGVRVVEEPSTGPRTEFESELAVDSLEQALFYLDSAISKRLGDDEDAHRSRHLFVTLSLYAYRAGTVGAECGGKSRMTMIDLGLGERNSQHGELTMPVIGNMLLMLLQGQKHLPARDNLLYRLLRVGLTPSKNTTLLCTFTGRADEDESMLQLVAKIAKAKRAARRVKTLSDGGSRRGELRSSEVESSSEQSGAETIIFLGANGSPRILPKSASASSGLSNGTLKVPNTSIPPLLKNHTPFFSPVSRLYDDLCSPSGSETQRPFYKQSSSFDGCSLEPTISPDHSPRRSKLRAEMEEERRKAILEWMDGHQAETMEMGIQCGDGDVSEDEEAPGSCCPSPRESLPVTRAPLEDIIEMDEDSMKSSTRSMRDRQDGSADGRQTNGRERESLAQRSPSTDHHPLSILSREGINHVSSTNASVFKQEEGSESELARMMAASVNNSMRSHEILSRVLKRGSSQTGSELILKDPMTMPTSKLLENREEERRKKKMANGLLGCCQQQQSTSSSIMAGGVEDEQKKWKDELRRRRDELKAKEVETRRQRIELDKYIDDPPKIPPIASTIARQITQQLHKFNLGKSPTHIPHPLKSSDSLPTTPSTSHRRLPSSVSHIPRAPSLSHIDQRAGKPNGKPLCFQPLAPRTRHGSQRRDSRESRERREGKTRQRERMGSDPTKEKAFTLQSPYHKVTEVKQSAGCGSSGRGSDDNASAILPPHQLRRSASYRNRNRDSYSASSGYESASADYHKFHGKQPPATLRLLAEKPTTNLREIEGLREEQRTLRRQLSAAYERMGQSPRAEVWIGEPHEASLAAPGTITEALRQENRILEKRLLATQNHCMLVTAFL